MTLGERLYHLRKELKLSQEEVAEKLNVTRQTVSKWETDESKPDFDKIMPICNLYRISSEELLTGEKREKEIEPKTIEYSNRNRKKKAIFIATSILMYFIGVIWIILGEEVLQLNDGLVVSIFLLICGLATCFLVFQAINYRGKKEEKSKSKEDKQFDSIMNIVSMLFCIVYLIVSFLTMAWHITWIIWIVFAVVREIIRLVLEMRREENGK